MKKKNMKKKPTTIRKKKSLTDKSGEVRELKRKDIRAMRPASKVLPSKLVEILPKRKRGERGLQKESQRKFL